jgi:hypothetical protein
MDEFQQQVQQNIGGLKSNTPPVIHSEPNALYEETCRRLEHYNTQIEKLNTELKMLTLMRDVLAAAQNAFDREQTVPARDNNQLPY